MTFYTFTQLYGLYQFLKKWKGFLRTFKIIGYKDIESNLKTIKTLFGRAVSVPNGKAKFLEKLLRTAKCARPQNVDGRKENVSNI